MGANKPVKPTLRGRIQHDIGAAVQAFNTARKQFIHAKIWLMIAQALFTPAQQKLLGLLFVRTVDGYHLNEIMRLTGLGSASAQRELKRLHDSGVIVSERIGNVRRFKPNKDSPVYGELSSIVKKTFGLVSVLNSALAPLQHVLNVAFVYGATAKEQEGMNTPVELLLIGDNTSYGELLSRLPVAERLLRRKINPNLYSIPDFKRRLREQQGFILQVLREQKIYVLGDEPDLDKIVADDIAV
ncbi:MAG: ArsR family transcriptional regulator [Duganella sp.]